jgi:hypothetical protein
LSSLSKADPLEGGVRFHFRRFKTTLGRCQLKKRWAIARTEKKNDDQAKPTKNIDKIAA